MTKINSQTHTHNHSSGRSPLSLSLFPLSVLVLPLSLSLSLSLSFSLSLARQGALAVNEEGIHILIDLNGHTQGVRMELLAYSESCPLQ